MAKTSQFTVTSVTPVAVVAKSVCRIIEIGEDPSVGATWPTTDFLIFAPTSVDTPRQKKAGTTYQFRRRDKRQFQPGDNAGYVQTFTGSTTFFQDEGDEY